MPFNTNVSKLLQVINTLRKGGEQMPIQTAHVFFAIMARPGITMAQLAEEVGLSQSSCSRNVAALGEWHRLGKPGYDLIESTNDPNEGRRLIMFLSPKGRQLARQLIVAIDPNSVVEDFRFPSAKEYLNGVYQRSLAGKNVNKTGL
ncbi:MarR family winged helix-turn-helix transcriptional regulator [Sinorhizobium sp. 8-89]|uniref:MarR family winged helix-turn-helix transcriptional regulator n=1 Tax=Sinorhizobium sp. 7-81 TaxID=3049087 RepID=UPI0024C4506D|nr:MarR family winged helix-turn-helix transcriptional regulator [Sinorhizobium sp. 7-81]MDK1386295.1 MarR family winged helix-turn-helix transcriptional regulator [Sinorhizobium sp. 7-81]